MAVKRLVCGVPQTPLGREQRRRRVHRVWPARWILFAWMVRAATALAAPCPGDCDNSGSVSIDDLLKLTNAALFDAVPAGCLSADRDGNSLITIDEVVAAVAIALDACPLDATTLAGRAQAVAHALAYLPSLELLVRQALTFATGSDTCSDGGAFLSDCVAAQGDTIRITTTTSECRIPTTRGSIDIAGRAVATVAGFCPGLIVSDDFRFDFDLTSLFLDAGGEHQFTSDTQATVTLTGLDLTVDPCRIRGAHAQIDGPLGYTLPADGDVQVVANGLRVDVRLLEFQSEPMCDPGTIEATFTGEVTVIDRTATPPVTITANLRRLLIAWHRLSNTVGIAGMVSGDVFGGVISLSSPIALAFDPSQPCYSDGILAVSTSSHTIQLEYHAGAVELDAGVDPQPIRFDSCLAAPLR